MGINTVTTVTCDAVRCLKAIEAEVQEPIIALKEQAMKNGRVIDTMQDYLQAGTYGFFAHKECFLSLTPVELCKALGLDEVEVGDDRENSKRPQRVWAVWS